LAPGPGEPATENQSPSSSSNNYFSPREAARPRPREAKSEGSEEEEETGFVKDRDGGAVTGSDYQPLGAGEPPPLGRWVYVKKERPEEDLCADVEEDGQHFLKGPRVGGGGGLRQLSIAGVRTLAGGAGAATNSPTISTVPRRSWAMKGAGREPARWRGLPAAPAAAGWGRDGGAGGGGDLRHGPVQPRLAPEPPRPSPVTAERPSPQEPADRHVNMHLNLRPFGCSACGKKFKMKHHLVEHMKIHTGHKPFGCHVCGKKFMWRDSFLRHRAACEKLQRATSGNLEPPPN
ncbi:zinc finger and BTB domain-containing protein 22-like, partial [Callorhinchus milii]|uniref:zinc finger and BTB domain-containing protein 22-like n=1 Tax=Callorhinchus milii TaxID=7868 RepID=UPI001C3F7E37